MSNMEAIFKHCKALGVGWTQGFTKLALPNIGQHRERSYEKETKAYTIRQNTWYRPSPRSIPTLRDTRRFHANINHATSLISLYIH